MQVQVIWMKLTDMNPKGEFPTFAKKIRDEQATILKKLKIDYPNVQIVYFASRIYGGYSLSPQSPEPYAYQGAFSNRWLILDQIAGGGATGITYENSPLLLWGPYLWADGINANSEGLSWDCSNFADDGLHPAKTGSFKVANKLFGWFVSDPMASTWFSQVSAPTTTPTPTSTSSPSPTPTDEEPPADTPTPTSTDELPPADTPTPTSTNEEPPVDTPTPTSTDISTPTHTPTATDTLTPTPSETSALTDTPTPAPTNTGTPTATPTPTSTTTSAILFADGFESGNFSGWNSSTIDGGDLSVSASAKLVGNYGMQAVLDDNISIYVSDITPDAEPRYRARFYFDPNSIGMASGNSNFLSRGYSGTTEVIRFEFRFYNGSYQVRAGLLNDSNLWRISLWYTIEDSLHYFEVDWKAATGAGLNNGYLTLWIDGAQQTNLTKIDNDTHRIDEIRLGAVGGIDTGTRGAYFFDHFESRRDTYIGP